MQSMATAWCAGDASAPAVASDSEAVDQTCLEVDRTKILELCPWMELPGNATDDQPLRVQLVWPDPNVPAAAAAVGVLGRDGVSVP